MSDERTETYYWLRNAGMREIDIPKVIGGNRQQYYKIRKAMGSTDLEGACISAGSFFSDY